jgi:ribosome biogenesis GTPase
LTLTQRFPGVITRNDGPRFWVDVNGQDVACVLRGKLKQEHQLVTSLGVVGDEVEVTLVSPGQGVIETIKPRRTELSRPGFHGYVHVMAANVDQMLIVVAAANPRLKRNTVERFIVAASRGGITPVVVVNKCDLRPLAEIQADLALLRAAMADLQILHVSAATGLGIDALRQQLTGRVSVLAGQSGVGKSSLVRALFPELNLRVGHVNADTGKGRHTTTNSQLYRLPGGGYLADTPGIRAMGLFDPAEELAGIFPDIEELAQGCKFRNCTHTHEPRCAVKAAVSTGALAPERLAHYQRLRAGE